MWEEELRLVIAHRYGAVESTVDSESGDLAFALARLKFPVWPTSVPTSFFWVASTSAGQWAPWVNHVRFGHQKTVH